MNYNFSDTLKFTITSEVFTANKCDEVFSGDQPHKYRVKANVLENVLVSETSDVYSVAKMQIARADFSAL
jgi:hypothetical protein